MRDVLGKFDARVRSGVRSVLGREPMRGSVGRFADGSTRESADPLGLPPSCSWEAMRQVYEEQAARGVPEAIKGLELIEQDRWPSSGRPRDR